MVPWSALPNSLKKQINNNSLDDFFLYNIDYGKMIDRKYSFFSNLCILRGSMKFKEKNTENILLENIWLNKEILINKKYYLWPKWKEKGIQRLLDIYDPKTFIEI